MQIKNPSTAVRLILLSLALAYSVSARAADDASAQSSIPAPNIPKKTFSISDHGAVGDGKTLNTDAITKTIQACRDAGGGVVIVPAGQFFAGPFDMVSKMNLRIDEGATLIFTDDPDAYPITDNRHRMCIAASKCTDIAITGKGTIDGSGAKWWQAFLKIKNTPATKTTPRRPNLIDFTNCQRVLVKGVTIKNSPMFHLVPRDCDDVLIDSVSLSAPGDAPNTDGIDPSGHNYLITRCVFDTGDDCIAFKPQRVREDGKPTCENMTVTDCTFKHGHGLSIGGQSQGGMRNLAVRNCTFDGTDAGIRMKAPRGEGGLVENLTYENITMKNVKVPIFITSYYPNNTTPKEPETDPAQPVTATTPIWRNIQIKNVTAEACDEAGRIFGLPEMPVSDLTLSNVVIHAKKGLRVANARKVEFQNCKITADKGEGIISKDAEISAAAGK
jgi:polygalacturonase